MTSVMTNWAGNVSFRPASFHRPRSLAQLRRTVAGHRRVRVLGAGHSFSRIADTDGALVHLGGMPRLADVDRTRRTVRVGAGETFGALVPVLERAGLALPNLPSSPHFTLAGAFATGTHGSGDGLPQLAAAVREIELVGADGTLLTFARGDDDFGAAVTSLGALGVATAVTLDLVPAFEVEQRVHEGLTTAALVAHGETLFAAAYSVSVFTRWDGEPMRVWLKHRTDAPRVDPAFTGVREATRAHHPIAGMPTGNTTAQLGRPGPWHDRLPHFRAGFLPSSGAELQSEYLLPRRHMAGAVRALDALGPRIAPLLQVGEIRTVAADDAWLSPAYHRDCAAFHFTWAPEPAAIGALLPRIEAALAPFGALPHWGKLFHAGPAVLRRGRPRWDDFAAAAHRHDPAGTFRNAMLEWLFPAGGPCGTDHCPGG
jgi:xylitol oxidase